jgi:hypothetical protein
VIDFARDSCHKVSLLSIALASYKWPKPKKYEEDSHNSSGYILLLPYSLGKIDTYVK